jgi:hypothetical protein
MIGHFQNLLEAIARDADQTMSELPLLGEAERATCSSSWNDTAVAYPTRPRSTSSSRPRSTKRPSPSPSSPRPRRFRIASSTSGPIASRTSCKRWAWARTCWWASASSARSSWWWRCSRCSRRAARTCPSTRAIRASASISWIEDAGALVLLTQAHLPLLPESVPWTLTLDTLDLGAESAARPTCAATAENLVLRDLHLRLDRQAQGRDARAPRGSTTCAGPSTPIASPRARAPRCTRRLASISPSPASSRRCSPVGR